MTRQPDYNAIEVAFREGHRAARIRYAPAEPNGPTRFENVDWEYAPLRQELLSAASPAITQPAATQKGEGCNCILNERTGDPVGGPCSSCLARHTTPARNTSQIGEG